MPAVRAGRRLVGRGIPCPFRRFRETRTRTGSTRSTCGATAFLFALAYTVVAVYRVERAGLDPVQLVLVGTTLEVTYFLFNVPTGVVANTCGRRLSVVGGVFLGLGAFLARTMREPAFRRPPRHGAAGWRGRVGPSPGEMAATTRTGGAVVRRRQLALTIPAVPAIFGGFSEGFDRLWEALFLVETG